MIERTLEFIRALALNPYYDRPNLHSIIVILAAQVYCCVMSLKYIVVSSLPNFSAFFAIAVVNI